MATTFPASPGPVAFRLLDVGLATDLELDEVGGVLVDAVVVGVGSAELDVVRAVGAGFVVVDGTVVVVTVWAALAVGTALWLLSGVSDSLVPAMDEGAALEGADPSPGTVTGIRVGPGAAVDGMAVAAELADCAFSPTARPQAARTKAVIP